VKPSAARTKRPLMPWWDRGPAERGSASLELAVLVPALVVVLGLLVGGGRLWFARTTVAEAAQSAARSASLARSADRARAEGRSAGEQSLSTAGLVCLHQDTAVDARAFGVPVGTPASITATITCVVPFSDLLLPGMPGTLRLTEVGTSALDTYRTRR